MIDLTEAVEAAARQVLGKNYETYAPGAMVQLKTELLHVIAPAYAAIVESVKAEVNMSVGWAFDHGVRAAWDFGCDQDEERGKAQDRALDGLRLRD